MSDYQIAPSILSADFARLGEEVDNVLAAGADIVHFDVMDNHYVPNLTIGPLVCEALRKHGVEAPIDVHLMVKPVDRIIPDFASAGASYITFHPEASEHIDRSLSLIRDSGCRSGLVFNPATPLSYLDYVLDKVDMVLLMSVNPGFGGQSFISCARRGASSTSPASIFGSKSTAASRSTISRRLPPQAPIPSFRVPAYSVAPGTTTRTAMTASCGKCALNWSGPARSSSGQLVVAMPGML
jgi:ribulose-phosphate 3-epimerase